MNRPIIRLKDIVDALEMQSELSKSYLNCQTGDVAIIADEEMSAAEERAALEDFPEWQQENIRTAIAILETDNYVRLPDQFEIHEWSIMRDFCDSVRSERIRQELLGKVHGKGAFRHFKDALYRHGIEKQWFQFRDQTLQRIARSWLEEHNIPYEGGSSAPENAEQPQAAPPASQEAAVQPLAQPQLTAIDHVQLAMPAHAEETARAFYMGVLGLQEVPKPPNLAKRGGAWFAAGSVKVHLGIEEEFRPAQKAHPAFLVEEFDAMVTRCQAAGYQVIADEQIPGVRRVYVADPFGNRIELIDAE